MIVSLGSAGHVRAVIAATEVNKFCCSSSFSSVSPNNMPRLNKAKRAARSRAAALRGRVASKPAPTPRQPAPPTPRRRPLPAPASTPRRPPPGALRAQSCLGCIKSALAGRSSGECHDSATGGSRCWRCSSGHSCLPL
ncbi:uncharacterized protein BDR25DRAFT_51002 [Lindgomyces ingoldianus]|uniref:Uncharacterized protein n=1 Tax=Lindgomyces ingoldianus TaxID=673940 RepID=A0ACB6QSM9_9PLEO|nr:uncharacterized protein BDR25DRAFT_51002 [Lindgomyces ingoldianus]KAF2469087.1 hypothetical protein BDR25DRAFT_51002 [Lindgomyces ingoldianus]